MRLRVGVIGLGESWETRHRPALRSLVDRYEVRAVSSGVSLLAEQAAADFHCLAVDGFRAVASREDIDAVLMLGLDWYGPLPILAACERGKAVYCATTLEMRPNQAWEIKRYVDDSGVAFMAELPRRQSPATLRLKELIATRLGEPQLLFCHQRSRTPKSPQVNGAAEAAHLSLLEQCDWCRYVVGAEVAGVRGTTHHCADGSSDYQQICLDFAGQPAPTALVSYGDYIAPHWPEAVSFRRPADLQVLCERGVAFVDLPANLTWFDEAGRHHESLEHDRPVGEQLLNLFHRSVTSLIRRTSGLDDACLTLRMVEAAEQSVAEGRRIPLD